MNTLRIVHPPHPAKPIHPQLAQQADDLHELRDLIRKSQEAERILTQQVLGTLTAAELDTFAGSQAVAIVGQRVTLAPDPQLFLEALGPRAWDALTVTVPPGRRLPRCAGAAAALLDWWGGGARRGIELHVVGRGRIEAQSASGYLMAGIEGVVAAHYRKVISEKTRDALARLRTTGRRVSRFPAYGYRLAAGGRILPEPREQAVLGEIVALRGAGLSLRGVSPALGHRRGL